MKTMRAIVSVTNDLSHDRRVDNSCQVLREMGYAVLLVGRRRRGSRPLEGRNYKTYRMRMLFQRKVWFYAAFNIRLFFFLLFRPVDLLLANDLDTLWANFLVSRIRRKKLVYDSHEFYTGTPELASRHRVRKVWERIEKKVFPQLPLVITVNDSIAALYKDLYGKDLLVIRNLPSLSEIPQAMKRSELGIPMGNKVLILQGAWINMDRGGEEAVAAMRFLEDTTLLVVGGGDAIGKLKEIAADQAISDKVIFIDRQPFGLLKQYTAMADVGLSLDKDTNVNYRFSLPNKLFDYIHCGVPVLASDLVEVRRIVDDFKVGCIIPDHRPESIAASLKKMLDDKESLKEMRENCLIAREKLCWDLEKIKLRDALLKLMAHSPA